MEASRTYAPRQMSTYLADDLSPAFDPQGRTMYYVSNQGGSRDIWARPLSGGTPRRLTSHSADEYDPAVSPDGARLAFTSKRLDAKGDLFLIDLSGEEPQRLTGRLSGDRQPTWFPDGRRLAFTRSVGNDPEAIFQLELDGQTALPLSKRAGFDPAISPDGRYLLFTAVGADGPRESPPCLWIHRLADGAEFPLHACDRPEGFGDWVHHDGSDWIIFSRFHDDTDGDGRIDLSDRPSLWRQRLSGIGALGPEVDPMVPLTPGLRSDIMPVAVGATVYYASRDEEDLDIWSIPLDGALRPSKGFSDAQLLAEEANDPQQSLFILRRCAVEWEGTLDGERCALATAERLQRMKRWTQAEKAFAQLYRNATDRELSGRALVGQVAATMAGTLPAGLTAAERAERQPLARKLLDRLESAPPSAGRRELVRADVFRRVGQWAEALATLEGLLADGAADGVTLARARLLRADVLDVLGNPDAAEQCLLDVLNLHADQREEMVEAAARILARAGGAEGLTGQDGSATERLETLARRWPKLPVLPAMVRVEVGDLHRRAGRRDLARRAFMEVEKNYAAEPEMVTRALLALAEMAEEDGDLSQALDHANELLQLFPDRPELLRAAKRRVRHLAGTYAEELISQGETGMAIKVFRQLLDQDPGDVIAHRQWIALMAARGRVAEALVVSEKRLRQNPGDDLALYLNGLTLTYADPPSRFDEAMEFIDQSLSINGQSPFAHQTRGWIFEQRFHLLGEQEGLPRAAESYQAALSLLDVRANPRAEADLLLNLGNVYFALGNRRQAHQFYKRRYDTEIPFALAERRLVFLEQFGRSALLSDEFDDAIRAFSSAVALSRDLGRLKRLPRLVASQAAAYQLQGQYDRAAELFARACGYFSEQGANDRRASCQRNLAYNLYMKKDWPAALKAFWKAEELVQRYGSNAGGGERVVSVGLGEQASRAASGFDEAGELNFLYTLIGRMQRRSGDLVRARATGRQRIALLKGKSGGIGGRGSLEMSIAYNQQAMTVWQLGQAPEADRLFRKAGKQAARSGLVEGRVVNGLNRLAIALADPAAGAIDELMAELQSLEAARNEGVPLRPVSRIRLLNGLGVVYGILADRALDSDGGAGEQPLAALRRSVDALDRSVRFLRQAEQVFRRARALALEVDTRQAVRLAALAGRNRLQALHRLGQTDEAKKLGLELHRAVDDLVLPSVAWLLNDGDPAAQAKLLLRLPPEVAGTSIDQSAMRARDELLSGLLDEALRQGRNEEAFLWAERLLLRRRADGLRMSDLAPTTYEDMNFLRDMRRLRKAYYLALDGLDPMADDLVRARNRTEVNKALDDWIAFRESGGKPSEFLRALFGAQPVEPRAIAAALDPGQGLLLVMALPKSLVVLLLSADGLQTQRLPLRRAKVEAEVAHLLGREQARASGARSQLSAWILAPFAERLSRLSSLVAVTDDLSLPVSVLIHDGKALGQQLAISHVYCATDLPRLKKNRNLNLQRLLWVGGEAPPALARVFRGVFGDLSSGSLDVAELTEALAQAGVVFFNVPMVNDGPRPLRSAIQLDERGGAVTGISLGRLASKTLRSALWILGGGEERSSEVETAVGLESAMTGAGVPSALMIPAALKSDERSALLADFVRRLAEQSPAEALRDALEGAYEKRVSWRKLSRVQLRGDGGMNLDARKQFAQKKLGSTVQAAMGAFREQRWSLALGRFLLARQLAVYLGQSALLPRLDEAIMQSAFRQGEFFLAAEAERRLLASALTAGDRAKAARARNLIGVLESRAGNTSVAIEQLNQAIGELDALGLGEESAEAQANLSVALDGAARYQDSLASTQKAMGRFEDLGKPDRVLSMMRNTGTTFLKRLNMATTAGEWFGRALALAEQSADRLAEAGTCLDLARTELSIGRYEAALALTARAEKIYSGQKQASGEAEAILERAKAYWYLGEYQRAFLAQRQALQVAETANDPRLLIAALSLGGLIDLNLGDLVAAERVLEEALREARKAKLKDEEATQLNNLGIVARERGDLEGALERFRLASHLDAQLKSVLGRAYDLRNIGIVEQLLGRNDDAQAHLNEALELSRSIGDKFNEVKTLAGLARLEIIRNNLEVAAEHASRAHDLAMALGLREVAWRALRSLGAIARREGRLEQAVESYGQAIELVERMRAGLKMERFRSGFLDNKYDLYEDMIHLLVALDRAPEAFSYSERSRARGFLDLLSNRQLVLGSAGDQALLDKIRAGRDRLDRLGEKVRRVSGPERVVASEELKQARQAYSRLMERLREQNPDLSDFVEVRPVDAARIGALIDPQVALLSFYVTGEDTLAFVVRREGVVARRLPIGRLELTQRVEKLRKLIENFTPADQELAELYRLLVAPVSDALAGAKAVGVLPHDVLHYLPFAALRDGPQSYWSERVQLFSSPSASVLGLLLRRQSERVGPDGALLAVGNPDLGDPSLNLPFAAHEARAIGYEQPGGEVLLGEQASEAAVRRLVGDSAFVHLASHGTFDRNSPLFSAVKLASGVGQDGDLTAMEVFSLPLSARLVTLSACQTGLGKLSSGDEIIGLNRSFLAAGAGGVLSSLWRVSDVATAVLMKRFYRLLRDYPPATALQKAQQVVRDYYPNPAYWAGFVLTGTWR